MISKGLIIDEPWIGHILNGSKIWEMRSTTTTRRGKIGLIRKGSGQVVGTARLIGCHGPLDRSQMLASMDKHQIPTSMIDNGSVDKWCYAWELSEVLQLSRPVPYSHPNGAVIWVNLQQTAKEQAQVRVAKTSTGALFPRAKQPIRANGPAATVPIEDDSDTLVPFAKDGTCFGRHLKNNGYFQVGAKGEEVKYEDYAVALQVLRKMLTARWRRPNRKGNRGIVTAVRWAKATDR